MPSEALAGRLLVATPVLGDPNFRRTVVLVVEHESEQGTLGVVLNRPTKVPVGQVLEPWTELATDPSVVFTGGPVAPKSALALAHVPGTGEPVGWHPLDGAAPAVARLGLVDLDAPPGLIAAGHRLAADLRGLRRLERRPAPGAKSTRAPGTWSRPSRPTRSGPTRSSCGPRCCAVRAANWPTWPPTPTIRA